MFRLLWISALVCAAIGCGSRAERAGEPDYLAGEYGGTKIWDRRRPWDDPIVPCKIAILEPAPKAVLDPRKPLDCVFRVEVPEGGALPTSLVVRIASGRANVGSFPYASLVSRDGPTYRFRARWYGPAPRRGRYTVRVSAVEVVMRDEIIEDPKTEMKHIEVAEASVEVRIR